MLLRPSYRCLNVPKVIAVSTRSIYNGQNASRTTTTTTAALPVKGLTSTKRDSYYRTPTNYSRTRKGSFVGLNEDRLRAKMIHLMLHGQTAQIADIEHILYQNGYRGGEYVDYSLVRLRKLNQTEMVIAFRSNSDFLKAHFILSTKTLNGVRINAKPDTNSFVPFKYDPLYISPQSGPGKAVSIHGLPYSTSADRLGSALAGYDLVDNPEFRFHLIKQEADLSTWLVRLKSEEEAQRLMRNVNATYYRPNYYRQDYPLAAEVFY